MKIKYLLVLMFIFSSCSKPDPWKLTIPRELDESSGKTPVITSITDLDSYIPPSEGKLIPHKGNNVVTIHENVIIRGKYFGRGPTLTVGEKAVKITGRTEDGGILAVIPEGIKVGNVKVGVTTEEGKAAFEKIFVKRYAAGFTVGNSSVVVFSYPDLKIEKTFKIKNPGFVKFSHTKPLLYVLEQTESKCKNKIDKSCTASLHTIDLTSMEEIDSQKVIPGFIYGFDTAPTKDIAVITTNYGLQVFSFETNLIPVAYKKQKWPAKFNGTDIIKTALSPADAKTLVLLRGKSNIFTMIDVQVPDIMKVAGDVNVLPEEKVPLLKTMIFDRNKTYQTLWIVTGDTPESLKLGYHSSMMLSYEIISAKDRTQKTKASKSQTKPLDFKAFTPNFITLTHFGINDTENTGHSDWDRYFYISMIYTEFMTLKAFPLTSPAGTEKAAKLFASPAFSSLERVTDKNKFKSFGKTKEITGHIYVTTDGKSAFTNVCIPVLSEKKSFKCKFIVKNLSSGKKKVMLTGSIKVKNFLPPFIFGGASAQD